VHRRPADRPHLPTAIAPPSADAPTTASPPSPAPSSSRPAYTKAWWPIAALDNLNPAVPNPLELMGEKLVAWKPSPDAAWVVQSDRCPHR
jgi:phenylpropionate dioxygenase-like ring-hydroxylating dioxygenase large terminal subunit